LKTELLAPVGKRSELKDQQRLSAECAKMRSYVELHEKTTTNRCIAVDKRLGKKSLNWTTGEMTVSVTLATYSVYFIEGSQQLFVKVRLTTSRIELAFLATPVNKSYFSGAVQVFW